MSDDPPRHLMVPRFPGSFCKSSYNDYGRLPVHSVVEDSWTSFTDKWNIFLYPLAMGLDFGILPWLEHIARSSGTIKVVALGPF
jgi:hypothetical protein